jgi:hypothetical protein
VATGNELSLRKIYGQASSAVGMVMGYADGGRKGSDGTGSIIQSDGLVLTNAHGAIEEHTGKPFAHLSVFSSHPESRESQKRALPYGPRQGRGLFTAVGSRLVEA